MPRGVVAAALIVLLSSSFAGAAGKIGPELTQAIENAKDGDLIRIYVKPAGEPDLAALYARVALLDRAERRRVVAGELKAAALENQGPILSLLRKEELSHNAGLVRSLWASNVVGAQASPTVIRALAALPAVERIELVRYAVALIEDDLDDARVEIEPSPLMPDTVWNLGLVDAPCAWAQGYTGQNIVVGHFDTGVNYNHVDLADHIWVNAGETPGNMTDDDANGYVDDYYGYDFSSPDADPRDDNGHGTHTAGTVAGDGTGGRATGVAPDAQIMSLKVLNSGGSGSELDVWEAIDYALDMGADVLTFSIGWVYGWNPDRATWRGTLDVARLAGVCSAVAAGNERQYWWSPPPENLRTPGDVPPPWLHPDQTLTGGLSGVVTAGATDSADVIADFSSMGPVSWETIVPYSDYPYGPQMGLLDPDVCAPGVSVTSLTHANNTGYVGGDTWSGTSMATPHVAGLMALMLSKNPSLTPAAIDSIIETTCLPLGPSGKDNDYGSGRIRVCVAIDAVPLAVEEERVTFSPRTVSLSAAPNPFAVETSITLGAPAGSTLQTAVLVYDAAGRLVAMLGMDASAEGGTTAALRWDGRDLTGNLLDSGVYFLRTSSGGEILTAKVLIVR